MPLIAFDARDAFVPMPHGSGIYVRELLAALRRRGIDGHELWALERGGRGFEALFEQLTLPRLLRRRRAALIHSPDSFLPLRRPCPGIVTIHDLAFEHIPGEMPASTTLKYRAFVPRSARSAERVICPSRFTAADVSSRYAVPAERIHVIPLAAALPPGRREPPPGPYVLAVGDLRPKKNLPLLVEAYRQLHREGLPQRLIVAGAELGLERSLRELSGEAPLELPGFVSDEQLDALLRGADALVVASVYEGFGIVVLDAMARGCPTVLARAAALPETGGDAAAYFDPSDAGDLARALREVLADPAPFAAAGPARASGFSWDATAAATVAVYEELLA